MKRLPVVFLLLLPAAGTVAVLERAHGRAPVPPRLPHLQARGVVAPAEAPAKPPPAEAYACMEEPGEYVVAGRVLDTGGRGVANAHVILYQSDGG